MNGRWAEAVRLTALLVLGLALLRPSRLDGQALAGQTEDRGNPIMREAKIVEHPGDVLPLDVMLRDQTGNRVSLGHFFDGRRPVVLVLGYYHCTMLCGLVLDGVARAVARTEARPGTDFVLLAVSIDPRDDAASARARRARVAALLPPGVWPFLTGSDPDVRRIAAAVGFGYRYDPATDQFAHAAAIFTIAPDGRIARYVYGIDFAPAELDAAIAAAARGDVGNSLTRILLRCFHYSPALRRHAALVTNMIRGGGALILVAALGGLLLAIRSATRRVAAAREAR